MPAIRGCPHADPTRLHEVRRDLRSRTATASPVKCGGLLFARYDLERAARDMRPGHLALRAPTLWRYREVLPIDDPADRLTMGEGFTPLVPVSAARRRNWAYRVSC